MKEQNENNDKNIEKKNRKGEDLVTRESIGAVLAVFTLFAFLILVTGGLIFGGMGTAIRSFLLGVFGYMAYLLLPLFFLFSVSLFIGKRFFKRRAVFFTLLFFTISVFLLVQSAVTFSWGAKGYLSACYKAAASSPWRATPAGFAGALIVYPLKRLTTAVGAVIIFSLLTLVFGYFVLRVITGKSPLKSFFGRQKSKERRERRVSRPVAEQAPRTSAPQYAPAQAQEEQAVYSPNPPMQDGRQNAPLSNAYQKQTEEAAYSVPPYGNGYGQNYSYGVSPEIRQRPGVSLSDSDAYGKPVRNSDANAFSPFAASTWGNGAVRSEQKGPSDNPEDYASGRDFLFSSTPAESYRKNLIFDHNSNVNRKPAADPNQPGFIGSQNSFGSSYTSAYANSINTSGEPVRPEKIVTDHTVQSDRNGYNTGRESAPFIADPVESDRRSFERNFGSSGVNESRSFESRDPYTLRAEPTPPSPAPVEPESAPYVSPFTRENREIKSENIESTRGVVGRTESLRTDFSETSERKPIFEDTERKPIAEDAERPSSLDYRSLFSPSNPNLFGGASEDSVRDRETFLREDSSRSEKPIDSRNIFDEPEEENGGASGTRMPSEPTEPKREDVYSLRTDFPEARNVTEQEEKENLRDEFRGDFTRDLNRNSGEIFTGRSETERGRNMDSRNTDIGRNTERETRISTPRETAREERAKDVLRGEAREETRSQPPKPIEPPKPRIARPYQAAPLDFFNCQDVVPDSNAAEVEENKRTILDTLEAFKVADATIASVTYGPTVTRYNVAIPRYISPKKVVSLDQEIAMNLYAANGVNIYPNFEDGAVSIEVPNKKRQFVTLGCMIADERFTKSKPTSLTFAMGKDVGNEKVYGDIRKMTHLLVAGASGSGKSVFLRALIISLLMRYSPADLRLILIDPKKTEFVIYDNLPHLVINEIITETNKVIQSLNWAIGEMNRRYILFEKKSRSGTYVVNIDEYNANLVAGEEKLPKIVIIVDELADLMLAAKKDIEDRIQNLTQKSRAAGIHMIIATQRPSADVITGVIKSNLKTRIAFSVASDVDSRVILDASGAQKLLGYGDMLYTKEGTNTPIRVQSPNIESEDAQKVVNFIKANNDCIYDESISAYINNTKTSSDDSDADGDDGGVEEVYIEALRYIVVSGSASISMIQRKCSVGYNKAGKIIEWMEDMGYISAFDGAKARKVLITKEEFEEKYGPL